MDIEKLDPMLLSAVRHIAICGLGRAMATARAAMAMATT